MSFPLTATHRRLMSVLPLVLALLFAQWLGLAHRIEHAGLPVSANHTQQAQASPEAMQADASYDKFLEHSCALFDAASLASVLHSPAVHLAVMPCVRVLALWAAFISWDAPFLRLFSSRAPPHA